MSKSNENWLTEQLEEARAEFNSWSKSKQAAMKNAVAQSKQESNEVKDQNNQQKEMRVVYPGDADFGDVYHELTADQQRVQESIFQTKSFVR